MNTSDLVLYHDIISEFEKCNFREASILHKHFIKIAQPIQDPDEKEAFEILQEKGLLDDYKTFAIDYFKSQPQFDIEDDLLFIGHDFLFYLWDEKLLSLFK
jgi:hypothetical protein